MKKIHNILVQLYNFLYVIYFTKYWPYRRSDQGSRCENFQHLWTWLKLLWAPLLPHQIAKNTISQLDLSVRCFLRSQLSFVWTHPFPNLCVCKQQEIISIGSVFLILNPAHSLGSPYSCGASSHVLKLDQHELFFQ